MSAALQGPFLTRSEAARLARVDPTTLAHRPDLLRIGGTWLEESYFAFQFSKGGVRRELAVVVSQLRRVLDDAAAADWLITSNPHLYGTSPLVWLNHGGSVTRALTAIPGPPSDLDSPDETAGPAPEMGRQRQPKPSGRLRVAHSTH